MIPTSTARRYAEAAFQVAHQDGEADAWLRELQDASRLLDDQRIALYFKDPNVPTEQKLQTVERAASTVRPRVLNLLRILVSKQRLFLLPQVAREFEALKREAEGIAEADVTLARSVSEAERLQIAGRLSQLTGKRVEVQARVDPDILGGIIVRIGDRLIDASVAGRLQRLRQELA
jgi:F-type H+-transporting ATPase subunit delta